MLSQMLTRLVSYTCSCILYSIVINTVLIIIFNISKPKLLLKYLKTQLYTILLIQQNTQYEYSSYNNLSFKLHQLSFLWYFDLSSCDHRFDLRLSHTHRAQQQNS